MTIFFEGDQPDYDFMSPVHEHVRQEMQRHVGAVEDAIVLMLNQGVELHAIKVTYFVEEPGKTKIEGRSS